tara:strand:+ start:349 stop:510 length:162 start_codon:yes stop_codon:yes gene_type:complete
LFPVPLQPCGIYSQRGQLCVAQGKGKIALVLLPAALIDRLRDTGVPIHAAAQP